MTPKSDKASSLFFAYGALPHLRAETIQQASNALVKRGHKSVTWQDLHVLGSVLITKVCAEIDESDILVAEVSDLNSNVLFEAGYALSSNKHLWLALDETDADAIRRWKELAIFSTIGRVDYSGNSEKLVSEIAATDRNRMSEPSLLETLMSGGRIKEANAVFAPTLPTRFQAALTLEGFLERQSHLTILGAGDDLGMAPLDFYVKEIYRSSAAIFHLLAPKRVRAAEHNARASFLAGLAHGFGLPVLMVVEEGFTSPLDYKDLLFTYDSAAGLQDHVKNWLDSLPKQSGTNKRLGKLALDIELPLRSFGQFVAEYEREELTDYFVETSEFRSILAGDSKVFVGRKGTGKTAAMSQGVLELRKDRRNLVVSVKPSAYELAGLVDFVKALDSDSQSEYAMLSIWNYLLYTEIAVRTVTYARERPAGTGTDDSLLLLAQELVDLKIDLEGDLSARLEEALSRLNTDSRRDTEPTHAYIGRVLGLHRLPQLKVLMLRTLKDFDRVAVLIDNLDKTWEKGIDYEVMSRFILALLTSIGRVEKDFGRPTSGLVPVRVTLTVFLRTDIYDAISKFAREPDKVGILSVSWQDAELLVRVLEERYEANRSRKRGTPDLDMWEEIFDPEVRGLPTRDYFLWRTLPRPRDFIYFANAALRTAINRKHSIISAADITFAEKQYSRFAIEALLVESEAKGFDLEEALYEFAGVDSTLTEREFEELLHRYDNSAEIRDWLIRTSFLGIEVKPGEFVHVEGETDSRRQLRVAKRFADRSDSDVRFRVHPAFRAFLEVRDDDLHNEKIRDATYDETMTGEGSAI